MIGKIIAGSSFAGTVGYVMKELSRILDAEGVNPPEVKNIIEDFKDQTRLNPRLKNTVGHISFSFSPKEAPHMTDALMTQIAKEYMQKMGITDTQYLLVRHLDQPHPHCHLVYNRVGNKGQTISDKNIKIRNTKVCRELTEKYGLHLAPGKDSVRRERLREPDKTKYEIYDAIKGCLPKCKSWNDLEGRLKEQGINVRYKYCGNTDRRRSIFKKRLRVFGVEDRPAIQLLETESAFCVRTTANPTSKRYCQRLPCGGRFLPFGLLRSVRNGWRKDQHG